MARRRPGKRPSDTPRNETDKVVILSGIFEGMTTGAPVALLIENKDADSSSYEILRDLFRPGHADLTYFRKYGHFDFRGGGRYSARETAARVAAGVVAGKVLEPKGITVKAYTIEIAGHRAVKRDMQWASSDPLGCPDPDASRLMLDAIGAARREGDSVGGIAELVVKGCPAGLGEPLFDKLNADIGKALLSVGTVKGVEFGAGFDAARLRGSQNNDPILKAGFASNRAGGILGGISNGDDIVVRAALKPIPSIYKEQDTVNRNGIPSKIRLQGRYDVCALPRALPVLEAMVKIVLCDHLMRSLGSEREIGR
jgi:chorismate synthase